MPEALLPFSHTGEVSNALTLLFPAYMFRFSSVGSEGVSMDGKLKLGGYVLACAGFGLAQFMATPYRHDLQVEIMIGITMLVIGLLVAMHGHSLANRINRSYERDPLSALSR